MKSPVVLLLLPAMLLGSPATSATERPVTLTTMAHETVEGTFAGASATGVSVKVAGQHLEVAWEQVATLSFVEARVATSAPSAAVLAGSQPGSSRPPAAPSSVRCQATTQKGTQCSRKAQAGSSYCWQHQR